MNLKRRHLFAVFAGPICKSSMAEAPKKLTWNDLFSQDPSLDFERIFSCWARIDIGRARPIGLSALGVCFFERQDGAVYALSPIEGTVSRIASSAQEFGKKMNTSDWQEVHLHSFLVSQILARGLKRTSAEVFGFAPHPRFGGGLKPERAVVLDATVWHSISGQSF